MTTRYPARLAATLFIFCFVPSLFAQGLYWESNTSGGPMGNTQRLSKLYAMPKMFRQEEASGDVFIVRLDKNEVFMIKPADKTYSVLTFAELEEGMKQMGSQANAKMAELRKQMKDMPEEQRKAMEKMMGSMMGGGQGDEPLKVTGPGERKTVNGYGCSKYVVTSGTDEIMTLWLTRDVKELDAMKKDWKEFSQRMASLIPGRGKAMAEAFKKIEGFPMETNMGGITTVVTKLEKQSTPVSAFEVPSGYTKTESPLKKMEH
jgi:hypothetical protein